MKILLLTPQLPYPPRQGTTIRNYNLIRELAARHTIDLLTFLAPGEALTDDNPLNTICRNVFAVPQPERTLSHRGRDTLTRRLPDMALRLESKEMRRLTRQLVQANGYEIVQTEGIELAQYGQLARKTAIDRSIRTVWVFDDHNCEYLLQKRSALTDLRHPPRWVASAYSLVQWQKLEAYERQICRQADAVVAVSPADAEALQSLVPELDVTVVSNGIDLELYPYVGTGGEVGTNPTLVFTGKMDYRPNIDAVLWFGRDVLPLIQQSRSDVRFQIVGMNPHPRLDELRANPAIEITGMVPETISYIQSAAVYVIPMRVGGGTRFKALEAMASGKPIVTTTLGVEGIPIRHGQELLISDTPEAFAKAVLHLLADDEATLATKEQMGISARAFVEARYGWQRITPKLEALYSRQLGSPQ